MNVKSFQFENRFFRTKVPIPFVEEAPCLPDTVFADGYFPVGTVVKFHRLVMSSKLDGYNEQINDYCHAAAMLYSNRFNGDEQSEREYEIIFHVDLSAFFLLLEPIDSDGHVIDL